MDDGVQLSLFNYLKINIYRDLEQNEENICNHPIIPILCGEPLAVTDVDYNVQGYEHDKLKPSEVLSVLDTDSSQQDAILLAKRGASFILQGPPGTGKSQTITNIIAELIAEGKKVLFVSEKMAALDVVYSRLTQVGLADFCLTLHNHKTKRRDILDQLQKTMEMANEKIKLNNYVENTLHELSFTRKFLNSYRTEIHTQIKHLDLSIFQVNGFLSQLENYKNIDFVIDNSINFTQEKLSKCESALEELSRIVKKSGYQQNNPWNLCLLEQLTFEFKQRFVVSSEILIEKINEGITLNSIIRTILDIPVDIGITDINIKDFNNVEFIYNFINNSPVVSFSWLHLDFDNIIKSIDNFYSTLDTKNEAQDNLDTFILKTKTTQANITNEEEIYLDEKEKCITNENEWKASRIIILNKFDETLLSLDISDMLHRYRTDYRSIVKRLFKKYRQDRNRIFAHCRVATKMTYEEGLQILDSAQKCNEKKYVYENQLKRSNESEKKLKAFERELFDLLTKYANISGISFKEDDLNTELLEAHRQLEKTLHLKQQALDKVCSDLSDTLNIEINESTDITEIKSKIEWCIDFKKLIKHFSLGEKFAQNVCAKNADMYKLFEDNLNALQQWQKVILPYYKQFTDLFNTKIKEFCDNLSLLKLSERIYKCKDNFSSLENLIDFRASVKQLRELGLEPFLIKAKDINLSAEEIIPIFKKCFYRSWLDAVINNFGFDAVKEFRRSRQDERVKTFNDLDKKHLTISQATVQNKLRHQIPDFNTLSVKDERAKLQREINKKSKFKPIRLLIADIPNLLPRLKPCLMMSPLSISAFLGTTNYEFDTVIFDEASQVRTEDAVGAIFRAKQLIIAGDNKQLPPTDFFMKSINDDDYNDDDENDYGAFESLLDEAILPIQKLLWHYRSRHEHLIAFSNLKIYNGNLITFSSSSEKEKHLGVEYIHIKDGIYDRGGNNGNKIEAENVAKLVFEHFKTHPKRSLGVITFGIYQQNAIEDAVNKLRRANPDFEPFFNENNDESIFIKNIEKVQGDERDSIIFSIGYAKSATGKFSMNFGPLSKKGGERRLNVAITRARFNLKLVGSILPTDITSDSDGAKLLRLYIDFAINGVNAIIGEKSEINGVHFDSPFENSVYDFLIQNGFDVATQIGCSGYRIDLAVRHPKYHGRYALGIECDGATYHSARTARERDRLRQTILEDMGWRIYRIWSTDWIKNTNEERKRLLEAVNKAINDYDEPKQRPFVSSTKPTDFIEVNLQSKQDNLGNKQNKLASKYYGSKITDIPLNDIVDTMRKILSAALGINKEELFQEVARSGYGFKKLGINIKSKFESVFLALLKNKEIEISKDGKIKLLIKV